MLLNGIREYNCLFFGSNLPLLMIARSLRVGTVKYLMLLLGFRLCYHGNRIILERPSFHSFITTALWALSHYTNAACS